MDTYFYTACVFTAGVGTVAVSHLAYSALKKWMLPPNSTKSVVAVELNYWGVSDEEEKFSKLLDALKEKSSARPFQICEDCIFTLKATRMPVTYYKVATLNEVSQKPEIRVRPVVEATLRYHREDVNSKQQHDFEELVRNAVQENWKDTYVPALIIKK